VFRHVPEAPLMQLLTGLLKLGLSDAKELGATAKAGNYQLACQRHFDITHPGHSKMAELANVSAHTKWLNSLSSVY
jgi:hypothetical protein